MIPLKILLVEDELLTAQDIREVLEEAGHSITGVARDQKEAMKLIKNDPPDLALIDITLGTNEQGGISVAREILEQHWIPFIYLTGHTETDVMEKAAETLPAAYLLKPFRSQELLMQVRLTHENFEKRNTADASTSTDKGIFYLPTKNGHERFANEEILYLKGDGHCTNIFLANDKNTHVIGTNLKNVVKYFTTDNFIRLSKSLFINLDQLRRIDRNHIYLGKENVSVNISEANRKELLKRLKVIRTK